MKLHQLLTEGIRESTAEKKLKAIINEKAREFNMGRANPGLHLSGGLGGAFNLIPNTWSFKLMLMTHETKQDLSALYSGDDPAMLARLQNVKDRESKKVNIVQEAAFAVLKEASKIPNWNFLGFAEIDIDQDHVMSDLRSVEESSPKDLPKHGEIIMYFDNTDKFFKR